uniref:Putative mRNA interferase YoeB n=1 Tax=uncultured bacterium contig00014 TaxID=1181505 RepID=A0A806K0V7_9BACT|nr:YoeB toxin protein [uncultured bacterium contig00014]
MTKLIFAARAWEDYLYWQETDKKMLKRVNLLLRDIVRNGNEGIGKPEPLKHLDGFSRRIDDNHRLVYQLKDDTVEILQCKGHYND